MLVAMPTAMPAEPFTSRLGYRAGITDGSRRASSYVGVKSTVSASMSRNISVARRARRASVLWLTKPFVRKEWSSLSTFSEKTGCTPASVTDSTSA